MIRISREAWIVQNRKEKNCEALTAMSILIFFRIRISTWSRLTRTLDNVKNRWSFTLLLPRLPTNFADYLKTINYLSFIYFSFRVSGFFFLRNIYSKLITLISPLPFRGNRNLLRVLFSWRKLKRMWQMKCADWTEFNYYFKINLLKMMLKLNERDAAIKYLRIQVHAYLTALTTFVLAACINIHIY